MQMLSTAEVADVALGVRRRVAWMASVREGAYLGQACSSAEILATLYGGLMNLGPSESTRLPAQPTEPFRAGEAGPSGAAFNGSRDGEHDRFILSPAHYSGALYATLAETGRLDADQFDQYATNGTAMEMIGSEQSPGLEATTGSLAQGLSVGVGMALARKLRREPGTIWVLISDGELEEGQTWEALSAASHHKLGNLVVIVDANAMQVDGTPASIMNVEPIPARIASFGLITHEVDGHDTDAITEAAASRGGDAPVAIVCRTVPWRGMPSLQHRYPGKLHFVRFVPGEAELVARDLEPAGARA
jgi:transketolase